MKGDVDIPAPWHSEEADDPAATARQHLLLAGKRARAHSGSHPHQRPHSVHSRSAVAVAATETANTNAIHHSPLHHPVRYRPFSSAKPPAG